MSEPPKLGSAQAPQRPWNKGKLVGAKPPLQPKHVWSIRTRLQLDGRLRDLVLFNLAVDSKLHACDLVRLRIEDVAPHGYAGQRATVQQRKTGRPVRFAITEQTRDEVDASLASTKRRSGLWVFPGRHSQPMTTRHYARLFDPCFHGLVLEPALTGRETTDSRGCTELLVPLVAVPFEP